jgi:hypothetical protein
MYRITITISAIAAIGSIANFMLYAPSILSLLAFAISQLVVYGAIAGFAHHCRSHAAASTVVLLVLGGTLFFGYLLLRHARQPHNMGTFVYGCLYVYAQAILAIGGSYIGFAFVESSRVNKRAFNAIGGKLLVVLILAGVGLPFGYFVA